MSNRPLTYEQTFSVIGRGGYFTDINGYESSDISSDKDINHGGLYTGLAIAGLISNVGADSICLNNSRIGLQRGRKFILGSKSG